MISGEYEEPCKWLHERLETLSLIRYPFDPKDLPENGIYFFYEDGERWGHGGSSKPRIVRVGTHRDGNFRSRIAEHFLLNDRLMSFDAGMAAPKDRSIFRKNLGRALIQRRGLDYLDVWNLDFTPHANRVRYGRLRNMVVEREIEVEVTEVLRNSFAFRFIPVERQIDRMGSRGLESRLIGTLARCQTCKPSSNWLGSFSPDRRIRESGLWQIQHLRSNPLSEADRKYLSSIVSPGVHRKGLKG